MGAAASATRSPNRRTTGSGSAPGESHSPRSASSAARNSSAAGAGRGVGAAEPKPVPARPRPGCSAIANEHTAMTMALRTPTLENCCGPSATGTRTAAISSSGASADRFTPVKNSLIGMSLVPPTDTASTTVSQASSGGWASPAGEAEPRLPPTVPRLRICGEPTVREAIASPGSRSPSSPITRA